MRHLVIGMGEVGKAVLEVLKVKNIAEGIDKGETADPNAYGMLHICIPCTDPLEFVDIVGDYYQKYATPNAIIVIHSSVPLGTTELLGENAVHSPIRGVHPHLFEGVMTFVKYFGGKRAMEAAEPFAKSGVKTHVYDDPRNTEYGKLMDTTQYGHMLLIEKQIYEDCRNKGLDFDIVYTDFNETYNQGYKELGMGHVQRPVLKHMEGKIGGHCVRENARLAERLDSPLARRFNEIHREMFGE